MDSRRNTYAILIGIILLTLPCYCFGIFAYVMAPGAIPTLPAQPITVTSLPTVGGTEATFTPTRTPLPTNTIILPTITSPSTPSQLVTETRLPTLTPSTTPTATPTETPTPTPTEMPTSAPTATPQPTFTSTATRAPTSTPTSSPTLTATFTPQATSTPTIEPAFTATATPTETPVETQPE